MFFWDFIYVGMPRRSFDYGASKTEQFFTFLYRWRAIVVSIPVTGFGCESPLGVRFIGFLWTWDFVGRNLKRRHVYWWRRVNFE